ncbi:MAG: rRNA maturation RNase YbeY [Bacteroidales bacterium]
MITYNNINTNFRFPNKIKCREWIQSIVEGAQFASSPFEIGHINIIFTDDLFISQLNHDALNHKGATDIITFNYSVGSILSGDLYIGVDCVKRNAKEFNSHFIIELHRVIAHGVLHLLSFDDSTTEEIKKMRSAENRALLLYPPLKSLIQKFPIE